MSESWKDKDSILKRLETRSGELKTAIEEGDETAIDEAREDIDELLASLFNAMLLEQVTS
jgi:hypothetical protein